MRLSGPIGLVTAALLLSAPLARAAEPADIAGAWSGGGKVRFSTGNTESARCRATFRRRGTNNYTMVAVCATASARAEQTATLTRSGGNRYSGEFNNAEFGISGAISITVNGGSMSVSLNGGGASAQLNLSR
jgi:hypothetical protein